MNEKQNKPDDSVELELVKPVKKRRYATAVTVAVLLFVIVLNVFVSAMSDNGMWYMDTTGKRYKSALSTVYTLSEQCIELVRSDAISGIDKVNAERAQKGEQPIKLKIALHCVVPCTAAGWDGKS